ncbi:DUF2931 family protein [Ewingella americana]|uniref:DUF2931 family protein n=1 Tax=Ewingella americana TaxID=41202 RepID=UPI00163B2C9B|nr:DUF2931 family protein [Ewingella americana]QMV53971.1 DUF2931 family protein [Ewingella americana]
MEITRLAGLVSALILTGCQSSGQDNSTSEVSKYATPYGEWKFDFFTPKLLSAVVTHVKLIDTDGYVYEFNTIDKTQSDPEVVGTWNDFTRSNFVSINYNKAKYPPHFMVFCWDSVIDKKVYETYLTFKQPIWEKMITPAAHKDSYGRITYYKTMVIGLAPEGKVAVWLQDVDDHPNYRVTPTAIKTLSGDQLNFCKGITRFSNGYEYGEETKAFIKGKTYPYGNW